MIRQLLGEALVEGGVFPVDDDALDLLVGDQLCEFIGFLLWRQCSGRDVARAMGQYDQQGLDTGVMDFLLFQHICREVVEVQVPESMMLELIDGKIEYYCKKFGGNELDNLTYNFIIR